MPRKPRLFFPNQPVHIVKRGHNRDPIAARKTDYQYFVECLASACHEYGVALHAWVLMTNHIHLLASPATEESIPKMMQWLGGHYARYFNRCYRRTGSVWEGRYKTSLIDSDNYLLKCYRYIELNPVRAGMVNHPGQYPWSSYRENTGTKRLNKQVSDLSLTPKSNQGILTPPPGLSCVIF
jgi:putative transposase